MIYFEWDEWKAAENLRVHGVDFSDARLVFAILTASQKKIPLWTESSDGGLLGPRWGYPYCS
jgi:hypothetical protein